MYILNKHEREALLDKLQKTITKMDITQHCIDEANIKIKQGPENEAIHWQDMELYLLQEQKATIEKALIQNEIDY